MEFGDLLIREKIDPKSVLVLRHKPNEPEFQKVFPWLAANQPDVFNAYQQTQTAKVEKAMLKSDFVASFIGHAPGKAMFIGLYRRGEATPLTYDQYWAKTAYRQMKQFGFAGFQGERDAVLWFDLQLLEFYQHWTGRLIVEWPGLERSWWRWADRNHFTIDSILERSALDPAMPSWNELVFSWDELKVLPSEWKAALSQWRGIY